MKLNLMNHHPHHHQTTQSARGLTTSVFAQSKTQQKQQHWRRTVTPPPLRRSNSPSNVSNSDNRERTAGESGPARDPGPGVELPTELLARNMHCADKNRRQNDRKPIQINTK
jgi:hypothetical protein